MSIVSFIFALLIAQILVFLEEKNILFKILTILFSFFLVATTIYSAYSIINVGYHPLNPAFDYIKKNLPNERFIKSMAPGPYNFYILKYNLNINNFDPTIWQDSKNQTVENLYRYMEKNNLSYVIFPLPSTAYGYYFYKPMNEVYKPISCTWADLCYIEDLSVKELISHKLIMDIYDSKTELFTKIIEFKYGDNVLFIAKGNF
jgi:hypothetical protein